MGRSQGERVKFTDATSGMKLTGIVRAVLENGHYDVKVVSAGVYEGAYFELASDQMKSPDSPKTV